MAINVKVTVWVAVRTYYHDDWDILGAYPNHSEAMLRCERNGRISWHSHTDKAGTGYVGSTASWLGSLAPGNEMDFLIYEFEVIYNA